MNSGYLTFHGMDSVWSHSSPWSPSDDADPLDIAENAFGNRVASIIYASPNRLCGATRIVWSIGRVTPVRQ